MFGSAVAHPGLLLLIFLLKEYLEGRETRYKDIVGQQFASVPTVRRTLLFLIDRGLIEKVSQKRTVRYQVTDKFLEEGLRILDADIESSLTQGSF